MPKKGARQFKRPEVPQGTTEQQAREKMDELLEKSRSIEADLGDQSRQENYDSEEAYESWRKTAISANFHIVSEYRAYKDYLHDLRRKSMGGGHASGKVASSIGHLEAVLGTTLKLEALAEAVKEFLQTDTDEAYGQMEQAYRKLEGGDDGATSGR